MKNRLKTLAAAGLLAFAGVSFAGTVSVAVSASSNPWLAGMPPGSTADDADVAPDQSPVHVIGLSLSAGDVLRFSATGLTDHCPDGGRCGLAGPEGDLIEGVYVHRAGVENGIANLYALIDSLVGVFLGATQPNVDPAPGFLDFSTSASRDFESLAPLLKQPFFIGDGFRNDGTTVQSFIVPVGASRLFLGTMDGYGWWNNTGSFSVTVMQVPEPSAVALVVAGLLCVVATRGRKPVLLG